MTALRPRNKKIEMKSFRMCAGWMPHAVAWLVALVLSLLLVGLTAQVIRVESDRTEGEARRELRNMTQLTQEHAQRTLRAADQALQLVRALYVRDGMALKLADWVSSGAIDVGIFHQVGIIDAHGIYRLSNLPQTPAVDLSDREHFKVHLGHAVDTLFVSKPVKGRVSGKWTIQLTRRITLADGSFGGVAVVSVDADYFTGFYSGLELGSQGIASLVGLDGVVRARRSTTGDGIGADVTRTRMNDSVSNGDVSGFLEATSSIDQVPRLHHYRRLDGFPLYVVVALATDEYRSAVRATRRTQWLQAWTGSVLLLGLAALYSWYRQREQRQQRALKASQDFAKMALESSGAGVWAWDIAAARFDLDERMFAMLGYQPYAFEVTHQKFLEFVHPQDLPRLRAALVPVLKGDAAQLVFEHRLRHKDGSWHWLMSRGQVVARDHTGRALRLTGTNTDHTERMLAEEQQRIAAVAFESSAAMMISAVDQTILRVNPAFEALSGYAAAEVIGRSSNILNSGRQTPAFYQQMWDSLNGASGHWEGELWNRRKDGSVFLDWLAISAVRDAAGQVTHYVAVHADITLRKRSEEEIRKLAFYDPLTGLPNRRLLLDRLEQARSTLARHGQVCVVLFMDLDHFKQLNDTQGHAVGDELLIQVAARLLRCVREGDTVARLGGDEFVVALTQLGFDAVNAQASAVVVANKIRDALGQPFEVAGLTWQISVSVGLAVMADAKQTVDLVLKAADTAMYAAKAAGRNAVQVAAK